MKRQHIASMVIVSASIFVGGVALAAQDRYTLTTQRPKRSRRSATSQSS